MGFSMLDMVRIVNRTSQDLEVTFNGMQRVIPAGYRIEGNQAVPSGDRGEPAFLMVPAPFGDYAKRQNVRMGTEDPENPRDVEFLVGVIEWGDDISHIEQSDAPERLDRSLVDGDGAQAKPIVTAVGRRATRTELRRQRHSAEAQKSLGIRADYPD